MKSSDIFISYRRKDVDFVKTLSAAFSEQQRDVWLDWSDIPPGVSNFTREIAAGIEGANVFVAVLSPDYLVSEYCLAELQYADQLNKRIVPVVCRPLGDGEVPPSISPINWVYFVPHAGQDNAFDAAFAAVLRAIDSDYDHLREHTRLLARGLEWQHKQKNTSLFLSGDELDVAEQWLAGAAGKSPYPVEAQTEFIRQSRLWQTRRQRRLLGGALVLLAAALVGLIAAVIAGQKARQQQSIAETRAAETLSMATANAATRAVAEGDYLQGLNLAYFASTSVATPAPQVNRALRRVALQPGVRNAYFGASTTEISALGLRAGGAIESTDQSQTSLHLGQDASFTVRNADAQQVLRLRPLIGPRFRGAFPILDGINPQILKRYGNPQFGERAIERSPDGKTIALGRETGLMILDNRSPKSEPRLLSGHELPVDGVRFSADGGRLVSRASTDSLAADSVIDREYIVWDTATWEPLLQLKNFANKRDLVAFGEEGKQLLFLESSPPGYTLWDVDDPRRLLAFRGPRYIMDLAFSPDGDSLVIASVLMLRMRPPRVFNVYSLLGERLSRFGGKVASDINDMPILFSADGSKVRALRRDGRLFDVDIASGDEVSIGRLPDLAVEASSNNDRFLVLHDYPQRQIVIWDLERQVLAHRIDDSGSAVSFAVSDDGRFLAHDARADNASPADLVVRDLTRDGVEVARFVGAGEGSGYVGSVSFTFGPDTQRFYYGDNQGNVHLVDTADWERFSILRGLADKLSSLVTTKDGRYLAAAAQTGTVLVWDLVEGEEVQRIGGTGSVVKLAFSPDGKSLLSGDERGQVALWQLTESRDLLSWVETNRALSPLQCADLLQAEVISALHTCPIENATEVD